MNPKKQSSSKISQDFAVFLSIYALCLLEPIFRIFSRNPAFLIDRRWDSLQMSVALCVLVFAVPVILGLVLRLFVNRFKATHVIVRFLAAVLLGLFVLYYFSQSQIISGFYLHVAIALMLAFGFFYFLSKSVLFKSWISFLSPTWLIIPVYYVLLSPLSGVLFPKENFLLKPKVDKKNPIVMVVFDELPLTSLINEQFDIEDERFPNFAKLAATSSWFRRAATVSDVTHLAVPALLTGMKPEASKGTPFYSFHPVNLFSLFGASHRLFVSETLTQLCPVEICGASVAQQNFTTELGVFFEDLWILVQHLILPDDLKLHLPTIHDKWSHFSGAHRVRSENLKQKISRFTSAIESKLADLYYLHINLPHQVFATLPDGSTYPYSRYESATGNNDGYDPSRHYFWLNQNTAQHAYQRHLLQAGYADTVLGQILDALKRSGRFDESYLIVAADHGISFVTTANSRFLDPKLIDNFTDVLYIPLFIKTPGQRDGVVSESNVQLIDVVPTLISEQQVSGTYSFDGDNLFSDAVNLRPQIFAVNQFYQSFNLPAVFYDKVAVSLKRKLEIFPQSDWQSVYDLNLISAADRTDFSNIEECEGLQLAESHYEYDSKGRVFGEIQRKTPRDVLLPTLDLILDLDGVYQFRTSSYAISSQRNFFSLIFDVKIPRKSNSVWKVFSKTANNTCEVK